jgi:hypothetical protein
LTVIKKHAVENRCKHAIEEPLRGSLRSLDGNVPVDRSREVGEVAFQFVAQAHAKHLRGKTYRAKRADLLSSSPARSGSR